MISYYLGSGQHLGQIQTIVKSMYNIQLKTYKYDNILISYTMGSGQHFGQIQNYRIDVVPITHKTYKLLQHF